MLDKLSVPHVDKREKERDSGIIVECRLSGLLSKAPGHVRPWRQTTVRPLGLRRLAINSCCVDAVDPGFPPPSFGVAWLCYNGYPKCYQNVSHILAPFFILPSTSKLRATLKNFKMSESGINSSRLGANDSIAYLSNFDSQSRLRSDWLW